MKIAFPVNAAKAAESMVYGHFGSAQFFVIVDSETDQLKTSPNQDLDHDHGHCQPLAALGGESIDAVVVGGIGGGALKKLRAAGIRTYRAAYGTVAENLALLKAGKLPVFEMHKTCSGRQQIGACVH